MSSAVLKKSSEPVRHDEAYTLHAPGFDVRRSLLSVLWRRRGLFLGLALPIFLLLGGASVFLPKKYVAVSLLAYDARPTQTVNSAVSQPVASDEGGSSHIDPSVMASEAEIVSSRATIISMLADHPELAQPPSDGGAKERSAGPGLIERIRQVIERSLPAPIPPVNGQKEETVTRIARGLTVTVPHSSSLIQVSFQAHDPVYAAAVANGVVAAYLKDQVQAKRAAIHSTVQRLQVALNELRQQVIAADQAVQAFRSQHSLLKSTAGTPLPNMQQLADLSVQEGRVKADLAFKEAQLEGLRTMSPAAVAALQPEVGPGSQMTRSLTALEEASQKRLGELEGRYLSSGSTITLLRNQVAKEHVALEELGRTIVRNQQDDVNAVRKRLGALERAQAEVSQDIQRENALDSQLLRLTAEDQSAKASFDTFLTNFIRISMLENVQVPDVRVVDPAAAPIRPAISEMIILILLLPVSALIAGIIVVIRHSHKSGMALTDREFEHTFGLAVVGVAPHVPKKRHFHRWAAEQSQMRRQADQAATNYTHAMRGIRNLVDLHLSDGAQPATRTVAIVSAVSGEGKSATAASLAAAWAASGKSVLLIDCDFHRRTLHRLYDSSDNDKGLAAYLCGQADLGEIIHPISRYFDLVPAGDANGFYDFNELTLRALLSKLAGRYDRVLLDLPPVLTGADAQIGAVVSDLTLLASRWDGTPRRLTGAAVERLRSLRLKGLVAVLTQADMKRYYSELGVSAYVYQQLRP